MIKRIFYILLWLLFIIVCFIAYLTLTENGLNLSLAIVEKATSGNLRVEKTKGTLIHHVQLTNLEYKNLKIQKVDFSWQPISLLKGQLNIKGQWKDISLLIENKDSLLSKLGNFSLTGALNRYKIEIDSTFNGKLIPQASLSIRGTGNLKQINLDNISFKTLNGEIVGAINNSWNLSWRLNVSNLLKTTQKSKVTIESVGKIIGPRKTPNIIAHLKLQTKEESFQSDIVGQYKNQQLKLHFNQNAIRLHRGNKNYQYIFPQTSIITSLDKTGLTLNLNTKTSKQTKLTAKLPNYFLSVLPSESQKINGSANINIDDVSFLQALIPGISGTHGQFTSDVTFSGTLGNPIFNGSLKIQNAQTTIDNIGLSLNKINLNFSAANSDKFLLTGSLYTGSSKLNLTGNAAISQFTFPFSINLTGNDALIYNNKSYQIFVSPDIHLTYTKPKMILSGQMTIPKATITPEDFSSTVTLPNDVIVIRKKEEESLTPKLGLWIDLEIKLGQDIYFNYGGLSANIGGSINLNAAPEQLTTATGNLNITKGTYKMYGTELKINKGNLIYTGGPINNPGLNFNVVKYIRNVIAAPQSQTTSTDRETYTTEFQNITVGMYITGTLSKPKITLFSEPSGMSQSDILSYLLFGFPSGQASGTQAQLLLNAAESTGIGGNITSDIKQTFGLSELGFQSGSVIDPTINEAQQNTSFVLGKYLTPKLYVSYSVGLLIPVNVFSARYFMSPHWMIQTDSNTFDNGADILYTIQTD